ncbi:unnamed protein product [Phytophthora fragariaefolia]|uniref:Unnamed protein product n=1 Tax=Phytophthora fragariaefolia TaxID=1490495 RepID=A0A9W7D0R2_9STRA|nr:unnamed protein product [Phytophthora fragariaefolia]
MIYDVSIDLYIPVLHALTTSMTEKAYLRLLQCVEDAVGTKLVPKDVVCAFEGALINAMGTFFPNIRIIGCLFHFKQACRRILKKYGLPNAEVRLAMAATVFDILTVINPEKIALQGVAWVKRKVRQQCENAGVTYSRPIWKNFWEYFARTWLEVYPPTYRNVFGISRSIVSRTNNPLERFHRQLNTKFTVPHPSLERFVSTIEILSREYVAQRRAVIAGLAQPPTRKRFVLPPAPTLPNENDIKNSESSSDSDDDAEDVDSDAYISSEISSAHDGSEDMEAQSINGIEAGESDQDDSKEYEAE